MRQLILFSAYPRDDKCGIKMIHKTVRQVNSFSVAVEICRETFKHMLGVNFGKFPL